MGRNVTVLIDAVEYKCAKEGDILTFQTTVGQLRLEAFLVCPAYDEICGVSDIPA